MVHPLKLAQIRACLDFEEQVVSFDASGKELQFPTSLRFEVGQDLFLDVLFGGRRKTGNRRNFHSLFVRKLPDESAGVQVVRPEVMSPFGQTMGLVEHPATDLSLGNGL